MTGRAEISVCRDGFTLLEMMVVLAVMGMLAALSLPHLRLTGPDAATAARDLAAALTGTRVEALAAGRPARFTIDLASGHYTAPTAGKGGPIEGAVPPGLSFRLITAREEARASTGTITFFPDGGATGGEFLLTGRGRDARVEIDWLTGAIRHEP